MTTASTATTATDLPDGVRQRILAAARAEFAAHGMRACSVRSIAARAGTTAAMINYYYGTKRALYDLIVAQAQERLFARITEALTDTDEADLPARLTGAYFDFLSEEHEFQRLLIREVLDQGESVSTFVHKYIIPLRALFEDLYGGDDEAFQTVVSLFGAVAGYFLYEPVMTELLGSDARAENNLRQRRQHVVDMAALLSRARP